MTSGQATNITKAVPTSFVNVEDDHTVAKPPTLQMGWSADGKFVLLSDDWDIWQVPVGGGAGTNLTVNGRKEQVRYRRPIDFRPDEAGLDLTKPVYVDLYGEWTKKGGLGVIEPGKPGVSRLVYDDAAYGVRQSEGPEGGRLRLHEADLQGPAGLLRGRRVVRAAKRITNLGCGDRAVPLVERRDARRLRQRQAKGDKLQGVAVPAGELREGQVVPDGGEHLRETVASCTNPFAQPNRQHLQQDDVHQQGYAVLPAGHRLHAQRPGHVGGLVSVPAVKAAIATGVVDPKRVGLMGHSWGGYQTAFLITQTDMFAAAVASAPITDWISMYSLIYKDTGGGNGPIAESSQGRFRRHLWDNFDAYIAQFARPLREEREDAAGHPAQRQGRRRRLHAGRGVLQHAAAAAEDRS